MKNKRYMLAAILLLAILAISAASASEDISDDVASEPSDDMTIGESIDDS